MSIQVELAGKLSGALQSFASTEAQIVKLGTLADPQMANELVQLRRELVQDFANVSAALEADPRLAGDHERTSRAMRLLAAFRTRNAINQADWPVIRVRDHPEEYRNSIGHVAEASRAFWGWIETELGFRK
jgi:hypothetical protein